MAKLSEHFAEGVSVTDNDGLFVISFIPEKPDAEYLQEQYTHLLWRLPSEI